MTNYYIEEQVTQIQDLAEMACSLVSANKDEMETLVKRYYTGASTPKVICEKLNSFLQNHSTFLNDFLFKLNIELETLEKLNVSLETDKNKFIYRRHQPRNDRNRNFTDFNNNNNSNFNYKRSFNNQNQVTDRGDADGFIEVQYNYNRPTEKKEEENITDNHRSSINETTLVNDTTLVCTSLTDNPHKPDADDIMKEVNRINNNNFMLNNVILFIDDKPNEEKKRSELIDASSSVPEALSLKSLSSISNTSPGQVLKNAANEKIVEHKNSDQENTSDSSKEQNDKKKIKIDHKENSDSQINENDQISPLIALKNPKLPVNIVKKNSILTNGLNGIESSSGSGSHVGNAMDKISYNGSTSVSASASSNKHKFGIVDRLNYINLTPSHEYKIYVTHVKDPILFWIQLQDSQRLLNNFEKEINGIYGDEANLDKYEVKELIEFGLYAVKFSLDNLWYRAKIISIDRSNKKVKVHYIDYGNTEDVPIDRIRELDEKLLKTNVFAIPVSLSGAHPVDNKTEWTQEELKPFSTLLLNRGGRVIPIAKKHDWPILFCKLTVKFNDLQRYDALDFLIENYVAVKKSNATIINSFKKQIQAENESYNFKNYFSKNALLNNQIIQDNDTQSFFTSSTKQNIEVDCTITRIDVNIPTIKTSIGIHSPSPSSLPKNQNTQAEVQASDKQDDQVKSKKDQIENDSPTQIEKVEEINENIIEETVSEIKDIDDFEYQQNYKFTVKDLGVKYIQLDDESKLKFECANVLTPSELYIFLIDDLHADYLEMEKSINDKYSKSGSYFRDISRRMQYDFVHTNAICIAQSPKNGNFYRALVKSVTSSEKSDPEKQVLVKYIDYGISDSVCLSNLFPITQDYCNKPAYAIECCLDVIAPFDDDKWSKEAIKIFKFFMKSGKHYVAKIKKCVNNLVEFKMEDPLKICIIGYYEKITDKYKDFLVNEYLVKKAVAKFTFSKGLMLKTELEKSTPVDHFESVSNHRGNHNYNSSIRRSSSFLPPEEDESFKKQRLNQYVLFQATHREEMIEEIGDIPSKKEVKLKPDEKKNNSKNTETTETTKVQANEMDEWNPCKDAYESVNNCYNFNEESLEANVFGYEIKYDKNICLNFTRNGKCTRPRCPFVHKKAEEHIVISRNAKELPKLLADDPENNPITSFTSSMALRVELTSFKDLIFLEAIVTHYYDPKSQDFINVNSRQELEAEMNEYYGNKKFLPEKTSLFSTGELVAAYSKQKKTWLRAKILDIRYDEKFYDDTEIEVHYVDYNINESLSKKELYPIKPRFLVKPFQSCSLKLAGMASYDRLKSNKELLDFDTFDTLTEIFTEAYQNFIKEYTSLIAIVIKDYSVDLNSNQIYVVMYATNIQTNQRVNMNKYLDDMIKFHINTKDPTFSK